MKPQSFNQRDLALASERRTPRRHRLIVAAPILVLVSSLMEAGTLNWEAGDGFRSASLHVATGSSPGFRRMVPAETGIRWTNRVSVERTMERQNLMNGSGIAAGDYDGDGNCDLYFANTTGSNALFRNLGDWKFQDVTEAAGVRCAGQASTGAVFADINGDGRPDLLVTAFDAPASCFLNLGNGRFTNVTSRAGLISKPGATSIALADLDGDGDLDLYICQFAMEAILRDGGDFSVQMVNGRPMVSGRNARRLKIIDGKLFEFGDPDVVYLNDGTGRFEPMKWETYFKDAVGKPVSPPPDFGLAVQIRDLNGDGHPDIYVCNDFQTPDRIWINDGTGHFRALENLAMRTMSFAAMGVDFADIDRDGRLDAFVVEMLSRDPRRHLRQSSPMMVPQRVPGADEERDEVARNTLFWNRGDGTWAEIAWFSGVAASDWSWTPAFLDVDLDGFEDILVTNGHLRGVNDRDVNARLAGRAGEGSRGNRSVLLEYPRLITPNAAFRNRGDLTFADNSSTWHFDAVEVSHGMALADLDNDGDEDVVINAAEAPPLLYRNEAPGARVAIRLKGLSPNTQGIGAKVRLIGGAVPVQEQEIIAGGRYLSGDDPLRVFAAGSAGAPLRLEVEWRSGRRSQIEQVRPNRCYEADEANAVAGARPVTPGNANPPVMPWFEETSRVIDHRHKEDSCQELSEYPLLPVRPSWSGPGAAWFDFDADGREDLILGGARDGRVVVFRNPGGGKLSPYAPPQPALAEDSTGIIGWVNGAGSRCLLAGITARKSDARGPKGLLQIPVGEGTAQPLDLDSGIAPGVGPVLVADVDADGDLDLFVGGGLVPGRYPQPADSHLFVHDQGRLIEDKTAAALLRGLGLVSGACFTDLDTDGYPELVAACHWGGIRVFHNRKGVFEEVTRQWGLEGFLGLWTSIQSGDFNGDGLPDLVVGNWGLNTMHQRFREGPWYLYWGDFNGDGQIQTIEAAREPGSGKITPIRDLDLVTTALPWIRTRFATHEAYSRADVRAILGERFEKARELKVNMLESTLLLNRQDRFEPRALPREAQWTPVWGLVVGDFNADGHEDVFLAQNFSAVRPDDDRLTAGRGLLLKGSGQGDFQPLDSRTSGIAIDGAQRAAAASDYDEDGRLDLVVTQHSAATRLFRNSTSARGLRIRLQGPAMNPHGIGCVLRLESKDGPGHAVEIHGGGGYLSQDGAVCVLGSSKRPEKLHIRWPGGRETVITIPADASEVCVNADGRIVRSH